MVASPSLACAYTHCFRRVAYHCYRGLLAPETDVYLHAMQDREDVTGAALDSQSRGGGLELTDCPLRPPSVPSANRVAVNCNDDEFFQVHKQVLRPCITLTGAVRAAGPGGSEVQVDVSCLVFDRVLLFLEAEAQARPTPEFGINLLDELLDAARKLGLRSLEEYCAMRLGEFSSRLREYSFAEIKQRNAAGECLIIVDGMVLDVTRWLPEHPGGSTIIPTQALNMDAARFYEVYHASRESFLYVKTFYIGALVRRFFEHAGAHARLLSQARFRRKTVRWCRSPSRARRPSSSSSSRPSPSASGCLSRERIRAFELRHKGAKRRRLNLSATLCLLPACFQATQDVGGCATARRGARASRCCRHTWLCGADARCCARV